MLAQCGVGVFCLARHLKTGMGYVPHVAAQHVHARTYIIECGMHGLIKSSKSGVIGQNGVGWILTLGLRVQVAGEVTGIVGICLLYTSDAADE